VIRGSNGLLVTGSNGIGKTALLERTDSILSQLGGERPASRAETSVRRCGIVWIRQAWSAGFREVLTSIERQQIGQLVSDLLDRQTEG
jgi:ABC-type transport system involved in cytochrome c biogenesis ATPase subunit